MTAKSSEPENGGINELFDGPTTASDTTESTAQASPAAPEPDDSKERLEKVNRGFTGWRKLRPFGAGLFMIFAGVIILMPAYLSFEVSNIMIQISTISGVSTLLVGVLLIVSGLMTWGQPQARILTGVTAMLLGFIALPTSNFGGFIIGTLFALIGGAWALSWAPGEKTA